MTSQEGFHKLLWRERSFNKLSNNFDDVMTGEKVIFEGKTLYQHTNSGLASRSEYRQIGSLSFKIAQ